MASSTNNAFNVLMAHRGPASITGAPATGVASILIVEVDNGTGTAPRDSSQSASVPAVLAVAAVASLPLGFLEKLSDCTVILKNRNAGDDSSAILAAITDDEGRSCGNDVAAPESIPLNVAACLSHRLIRICAVRHNEARNFF